MRHRKNFEQELPVEAEEAEEVGQCQSYELDVEHRIAPPSCSADNNQQKRTRGVFSFDWNTKQAAAIVHSARFFCMQLSRRSLMHACNFCSELWPFRVMLAFPRHHDLFTICGI